MVSADTEARGTARADYLQAANSQGIQTLLEAEKEASKVVQKARQYRVQKLKDARSEAAKEIEAYKAKKEEEFNKFESDHTSQTTSSQTNIDSTTKTQLANLDSSVEKNKGEVIKKIVERVLQSDPHLHPNLKKIEA
ncbi:V-type ATPase, G subunit [Cryptococcus amylolentus CBS 6273]|uniref:V-type proton ATPase subunit G n=1 Tax=Cryptococcus amylolentus CBS 6273 TaxID=1296118 RepID=A0A1E3JVR2_9TREE|nr:V-type ATPase, G subunit [Cryptococcus amylolentus CBS 6273]